MDTKDWRYAVKREKFEGHPQTVIINGKSAWGDETEQDYINQGFEIIGDAELDEMCDKYYDSICGDWKEVPEQQYNEMLNVLPPLGS